MTGYCQVLREIYRVTRPGGIPEIIRPAESGRIFPASNARKLAATIEDALTQAEKTRRYSANGREFVEREHSLDHMLDRLGEIYSRHIARATQPSVRD